MANATIQPSRDWLGSRGSSVLAWWIPHAAILAGLFVPTPIRVVIWTIALIWMGAACVLNARQCGRTHCRYTGPYYLAMIAPVLVLGSGMVSAGIYGWIVLGVIIVGGSKLIWWATERAWGNSRRYGYLAHLLIVCLWQHKPDIAKTAADFRISEWSGHGLRGKAYARTATGALQ